MAIDPKKEELNKEQEPDIALSSRAVNTRDPSQPTCVVFQKSDMRIVDCLLST